ncbi:PREDICTED: suppressor of Mek1-like isoform X2 [Ipomoea nil]|uniref:suppressor of Mek1-like isoform X2 n=1 Tax=Ipomoea nil TaxID=35883 RepID=UPI000901DBB7|nr:PREDICTED: suppressor of Mek1-like isoform X2 [Ipomoea nil]
MFRQSPTSRNHRSKGFKSKHVLQFCLLLAICFWLIYQVKRSHEKRKEFDENDSKFSLKTESSFVPTMWGRKGLLPRSEEITLPNGKQDKQVEDENPEEDEENKPEEEEAEQDQDSKFEEENDEDRGGGDDMVDEHNQEKSDEEVEQEEELVDDEKDRGEVDETDMKNSQDHELDEDSRSTHEAQEELYKADDASSAVTHDTQTVTTENENGGLEAANENAEVKIIEHESNPDKNISFVQNITLLKLDDHETTGSNSSLNTTSHEESIPEHVSSDSKNTSIVNLRSVVESNNTEVSGETHNVSLQNLTQSSFDSTIDGNVTTNETAGREDSKLPTAVMQHTQSDSNLTSIQNEDSNSTSVNATHEDGAGDKSHTLGADTSNEVEAETSETGGIDERLEFSNTENLGEIGQDLIDPSDTFIPLEEKEVDTDLETLPDIQTEGSNTEDVAAE